MASVVQNLAGESREEGRREETSGEKGFASDP
jgi:hypothetical protein